MYPSILVTLIVFTYIGGLSLEQETATLAIICCTLQSVYRKRSSHNKSQLSPFFIVTLRVNFLENDSLIKQ